MKTGVKNRLLTTAATERARKARFLTPLFALAIAIAVTLALGFLLDTCNLLWIRMKGEAEAIVRPATLGWFLLAVPLSLGTSILMWDRINNFLLGPPPPNFSLDYVLESNATPPWLLKSVTAVVIGFGLLSALNVRKHARLTEDGIVEQRALSLSENIHSYSRVSSVTMARYHVSSSRDHRSGPSQAPAVFVSFDDGTRWSVKDSELSLDPAVNAEIANRIAEHSRVRVDYSKKIIDQPTPKEQRAATLRGVIFFTGVYIALAIFLRYLRSRKSFIKSA